MPKKKIKEDIQEIRTEQLEIAAGQALTGSAAGLDDVIIQCDKGIVTRTDIENACNEYLDTLPVKDMIYKNQNMFIGLLLYIYRNILYKYTKDNYRYNYKVLDSIFDNIYMPLCLLYGYTPNIYMFCTFLNLNSSYIYSMLNSSGLYNSDGTNISKDKLTYLKKWHNTSESMIANRALEQNSIGSLFILKSKYAWTENNTLTINANAEQSPKLSIDQLNAIGEQDTLPTTPEEDI